jgi:hypothetical protein
MHLLKFNVDLNSRLCSFVGTNIAQRANRTQARGTCSNGQTSSGIPDCPLFKVSVTISSLTKSPSATLEQFQDNNLAKNE